MHTVIVLQDGETWCQVSGTSIIVINDDDFSDLQNNKISVNDIKPVIMVGIHEYI